MASTYLSRNTWGTATDSKIFTISTWVKRSELSAASRVICESYDGVTGYSPALYFNASYQLRFDHDGTGTTSLATNQLFRDCNGFYHIVISVDTTQATSSNRVKMYVNGEQITSFSTETYPTQNSTTQLFNNSNANNIGSAWSGGAYFDGSMAHFHFIDGTQYAASDFGETDATTGIWKPKTAPSVTYGTNGFFLKFENSGSMGTDSSGNGNNFTVNGNLTQNIDTPSNVFATWNPLIDFYPTYTSTLSNGNLSTTRTDNGGSLATIMPSKGKWYMEAKCGTVAIYNRLGVVPYDKITDNEFNPDNKGVSYQSDGDKVVDGTASTYGSTYTTGDIIGIALNLDDGEITFYKNGVAQNSGTPITGFTYDGANSLTVGGSGSTWSWDCNFGNGYFGTTAVSSAQNPDDGIGIFEYSVPTGYRALCTKSINAQEYS